MADLFEPLRDTRDQSPPPALPPEEVRRRGDRLRRRRTATAAAGATLAVALVAGGGLALGGGVRAGSAPAPVPPAGQTPDGTTGPTPTPGPGTDWLTSIPTGFPLADDLEEPTSTEEQLAGPGRDVRVFDVPFEACGRRADLGAPVASLAVRHTAPEWFDGRVLQVYGDDGTARSVLEELVAVYDNCPKDVFEGPPDSVAAAVVRPVPLGEEGYLVTRTFSTDGLRTTGLELLYVVQVGNALLVSNLSSEGGSSDASVARSLGEREPVVAAVAEAMCIFAADGCEGTVPQNPSVALEGALLRLTDIRELTRDLRTDWRAVPGGAGAVALGCSTDPVESLDPLAALTRTWEGTAATGVVNTRAGTAVLELGDAGSAEEAYDAAVTRLEDCAGAFAVAHEPIRQRTPSGPATWRVVEEPAPEICTECHTAWIDAQAVALVGSRVVLLSIAYTGDMMSGANSGGSPMVDAIARAARLAADSPTVAVTLGPLGVGPVRLGDSPSAAERTGAVTFEDSHDAGCSTFNVLGPSERNLALGYVDADLGVAAFFASQGVNTPEGVGVGSGQDQVEDAYPGVEDTPAGSRAPVPGFDDRFYVFTFEGGQVSEVALVLDGHGCFG